MKQILLNPQEQIPDGGLFSSKLHRCVFVFVCSHLGNKRREWCLTFGNSKPVCCQLSIALIPSFGQRGFWLKPGLYDPIHQPHRHESCSLVGGGKRKERNELACSIMRCSDGWRQTLSGHSINRGGLWGAITARLLKIKQEMGNKLTSISVLRFKFIW